MREAHLTQTDITHTLTSIDNTQYIHVQQHDNTSNIHRDWCRSFGIELIVLMVSQISVFTRCRVRNREVKVESVYQFEEVALKSYAKARRPSPGK